MLTICKKKQLLTHLPHIMPGQIKIYRDIFGTYQ